MSDLHAINEAINKKAGRKLIPSILVSLFLLAVILLSIAYVPVLFALFVGTAVLLATRELVAAFHARGIEVRFLHLGTATAAVLASSWIAGMWGTEVVSPADLPTTPKSSFCMRYLGQPISIVSAYARENTHQNHSSWYLYSKFFKKMQLSTLTQLFCDKKIP